MDRYIQNGTFSLGIIPKTLKIILKFICFFILFEIAKNNLIFTLRLLLVLSKYYEGHIFLKNSKTDLRFVCFLSLQGRNIKIFALNVDFGCPFDVCLSK